MEKPPINESKQKEKRERVVDYVETEKGSIYKYLPDGRTQRYKKVTGKYQEPQDVLVFIPDWKWVGTHAPKKILEKLGKEEIEYEQKMLEYTHEKGKRIFIIDEKGNILETNNQVKMLKKGGHRVLLAFGRLPEGAEHSDFQYDFTIPVSGDPKEGYSTFDTRKWEEGEKLLRQWHIGHKVTKIVYKS